MASTARILFVDDEPDVLSAFRRIFHRERPVWEMVFASSGEAALEEMRRSPADVVVSDLRMPSMDGADLMQVLRREFPKTMRIVLSGYADSELFERAWPMAHLMLTKPCEHKQLRDAIARMVVVPEPLKRVGT
jgi:YesN/AraC family two-component response regulator